MKTTRQQHITNALEFLKEAALALDQAEAEMRDAGCERFDATDIRYCINPVRADRIFDNSDRVIREVSSNQTVANITDAVIVLHAMLELPYINEF